MLSPVDYPYICIGFPLQQAEFCCGSRPLVSLEQAFSLLHQFITMLLPCS
jgi:hypothetical protein